MEIGLCSDGRQCGDPKFDQVYMFYGVSFPWETFGDKEYVPSSGNTSYAGLPFLDLSIIMAVG